MDHHEHNKRDAVHKAYGRVAKNKEGCGCGPCGPDPQAFARSVGYAEQDLDAVPGEANLGLGCGNPTAIASLRPGEVALTLGRYLHAIGSFIFFY
jgi:hypothetical protein